MASMVQPVLIQALQMYVAKGTENERQLAQLSIDLVQLAGDHPLIEQYINQKAAKALDDND
jgi:hypothetical protein